MKKIKFLIVLFVISTICGYSEEENSLTKDKFIWMSPTFSKEGFNFIKETIPYLYLVEKNGDMVSHSVKKLFRIRTKDGMEISVNSSAWSGPTSGYHTWIVGRDDKTGKLITTNRDPVPFEKKLISSKTSRITDLLGVTSHVFLKKAPRLNEDYREYDYSKRYNYSPFKKPKKYSFEEKEIIEFTEKEIEELKNDAEKGTPDAQFKYGLHLFYKKDKNCITYLSKSHEQGNKNATLLYAYILSLQGGKSNSEKAFDIYLKLAEKGDITAINYALLNLKNLTRKQDDEIKRFLKLDSKIIETIKFNRLLRALEERLPDFWGAYAEVNPISSQGFCNFYEEDIISCSHNNLCQYKVSLILGEYFKKIKISQKDNPDIDFYISAMTYLMGQAETDVNEKKELFTYSIFHGIKFLNNITKMKGGLIPTNYSMHRNKRRIMTRFFIVYSMIYLRAKDIIHVCKEAGLDLQKEGYKVFDCEGNDIYWPES